MSICVNAEWNFLRRGCSSGCVVADKIIWMSAQNRPMSHVELRGLRVLASSGKRSRGGLFCISVGRAA
jgi:hypothetical protein